MEHHIILQDLPAEHAVLGFDVYASTLAQVIRDSKPRFAIGIFGGWGAGKTTLMNAVRRQLASPSIINVEFSAWRYEREPNLIVPLLDVIREALVEWAKGDGAREAATSTMVRTLGRAVKALLAGFAFKAGLPLAMEVSLDASKVIDTWDQAGLEANETARSLYHACFTALGEAFRGFSTDDASRRIVVFVDDLDRCLPNGAIEVIEAMKLFFDLPGFVFVVGLDQKVIEAAVEIRYRDFNAALNTDQARVSGEEYIKKIFQVPFSLAPVSANDLASLVSAYLQEADAPPTQCDEVDVTVLPHLRFVVGQAPINPRDVKRFINAYTITHAIKPNLDRNVVLALQSMNYRPDWRVIYRWLLSYRSYFIRALKKHQEGAEDALEDLDDELAAISTDFLQYVSPGQPAHALLSEADRIDEYIYAGEALKSSGDPGLVDAVFELTAIRGRIKDLPTEGVPSAEPVITKVKAELEELTERLMSHSLGRGTQELARRELTSIIAELGAMAEKSRQGGHSGGSDGSKGTGLSTTLDWGPLSSRIKKLIPRLIVNY